MTFWKGLRTSYGGSLAFLAACPLLALVPVVFELLQHVAEVHIGMYDSIAAAKALEHHPLRMALGMVKVLALLIPTYWITRFVHTRDPRFAAQRDPLAMRLFAGVVAIHIALSAAQLFGLPQTPGALRAGLAGGLIVQCLLVAWTVAQYVKSNAIVFCADGMTLGVGAGQMSRIDSARIASIKAENAAGAA